MSQDLLNLLRDNGAFDPAPRHAELSDMHVPFDTLSGARNVEHALLAGLRAGNRIALLGASGSGKSSVVAYTLGPLVEGIFPIPVPVYPEPATVAGNGTEFVAHLVRTISRMLQATTPGLSRPAQQLEQRATAGGTGQRRHRISAGWRSAGLGPELAYELERAVSVPAPTAGQVLDQGRQILDLVAADGLVPILILDDTDRWLAATAPEIARVRREFFFTVPRLLAEDLGAAAVIAVHPEYLQDPGYQAAQGFLTDAIQVPAVPSAAAVGAVLARRVELARAAETPDVAEVFTPDALEVLYAHYTAWPSNIRRNILLPAHTALSLALDDGVDRIDEGHIMVAITS
ncbi:hypothetical protein [Nakamurella lactea]|uniref:hypothetical protein n=1 Tax=Nakamurella lactea TaxID=459515 RepID=UPI000429C6E1|nr:hypothetical protein [Nakamurella lactea]